MTVGTGAPTGPEWPTAGTERQIMALWPFGKKNDDSEEPETPGTPGDRAPQDPVAQTPVGGSITDSAADAGIPEPGFDGEPDPEHDAVHGDIGPFDAGEVSIADFDFSDFARGILDLGSVQIPMPLGSEVQVEMGEAGPRMLHIVTQFGRITPVAFAAPRSSGQWRESTREIAEGMRRDGLSVRIERGPWGREVVGEANDRIIRIIGVDGPRWMLRLTMISPIDRAEAMVDLGREVIARTFVNRGDAPILAGSPLPVALPQELAAQVQEAMAKRAAQQGATPPQNPGSAG